MNGRVSGSDTRNLRRLELIIDILLPGSFILSNNPAVLNISDRIIAFPVTMFLCRVNQGFCTGLFDKNSLIKIKLTFNIIRNNFNLVTDLGKTTGPGLANKNHI